MRHRFLFQPARKHRSGFTLIELLIVIIIVGLLLSLLLPAIQAARESARRMHCTNNLKQFTLALNQFEVSMKNYPSGGWGHRWYIETERGSGKNQPGGWPYHLLPYIEQIQLYQDVEDSEKQKGLTKLLTSKISMYYCTTRRKTDIYPWVEESPLSRPINLMKAPANLAKSDYAINGGDIDPGYSPSSVPLSLEIGDDSSFIWDDFSKANGICFFRSEVRSSEVEDGLSYTYSFGEKWVRTKNYDMGDDTSPYTGYDKDNTRWTFSLFLRDNDSESWDQFGSAHPAGCNFAFCDGSVQTMSYKIESDIHRYLGSRNDNEVVKIP